jgi:hypothetical protein
MKITITEDSSFQLEEVFNGVILKTLKGETFSICMRDNGFEFTYGDMKYEAKDGKLEKLGCTKHCGMGYCDDNGCIDRKRYLVEDDLNAAPL